ncbi:MAG: PepSY domain-containing protein [Gammaproteobacteria bacterium]|nr:PepSY domain-containing protein [Gammaproteobacteria bacterium]
MKQNSWILIGLLLLPGTVFALSKSDVRAIIEAAYPGARITEIEKEQYKGQKIYEVDFKHGGENLEAIISLDGEIIKVGVDD